MPTPKSDRNDEHVHGADCDHDHAPQEPFRRSAPKLGRNDPCHCGSGRKFKKCHGAPAS
jgi:preprotein translocase subunit SecA